MKTACVQCPWRLANQGKKPDPHGFYTLANARRLWNGLRKGVNPQSCHLTDPSHPDHVAVGAPENAKPQECPGSVILIRREMARMADATGLISDEGLARYKRERPKHGLTNEGLRYWLLERLRYGGVPLVGGPKLPEVNDCDESVGLPEVLRHG